MWDDLNESFTDMYIGCPSRPDFDREGLSINPDQV